MSTRALPVPSEMDGRYALANRPFTDVVSEIGEMKIHFGDDKAKEEDVEDRPLAKGDDGVAL